MKGKRGVGEMTVGMGARDLEGGDGSAGYLDQGRGSVGEKGTGEERGGVCWLPASLVC